MSTIKLLGAALVVSTMVAAPVWAQGVIQEPGAYAQNYPYADLGIGTSSPWPRYPGSNARSLPGSSDSYAYMNGEDNTGYHARHRRLGREEQPQR